MLSATPCADKETSRVLDCTIFKSAFIQLHASPDCVCFWVCLPVIMLIKQLLLRFLGAFFPSLSLCLPTPFHSLISVIMSEWQVLHAMTLCKTELEDRTSRVNIRHPVQQAWGCGNVCTCLLAFPPQGSAEVDASVPQDSDRNFSLLESLYRLWGNFSRDSGMCSGVQVSMKLEIEFKHPLIPSCCYTWLPLRKIPCVHGYLFSPCFSLFFFFVHPKVLKCPCLLSISYFS